MVTTRISSSRAAGCLLAIIALAALIPSTSLAATISTTYNLTSLTLDGFQFELHDFTVDATQFNPALGALDSIDVVWSITNELTATQTSGNIGDSLESQSSGLVFFNGQNYDGITLPNPASATQFNTPFTSSVTGGSDSVTELISGVNISGPDFQGAIGIGTVPVEFQADVSFAGADSFSDQSTTVSGSVEVSYNYTSSSTAVPLPNSLSMSMLGLGMLASFGLLKKAKGSSISRRIA
ncbi:MAG TPA: hypothetical protein VHX86_13850 [Tepidisphaeraceae bacterium]|jgi:hypothetical protein|nr:hypothetical protein [Tepidisphaeraceae bacterium]